MTVEVYYPGVFDYIRVVLELTWLLFVS